MTAAEDKVNILVVDDLPDKLLALRSILEDLGQNVVEARSGRDALRKLLEQDYAVILLDVNMPDIDGFETARMIRQRRRSEFTPIIFITAFSDEMHAAQGYQLGAVDYIQSPVNPAVLRTKVGVFAELFRKTEQVKRQAEQQVSLARAQAARAVAEAATRRSLFLAEASTTLANSLNFEDTVRGLLSMVVPFLADLAAVTVAGEHGAPWHSELAWVKPPDDAREYLTLSAAEGPDDELRAAIERVLAAGQPEVLDGLNTPYPPGPATGVRTSRLCRALVLPLQARGRTLGALTLAQSGSERRFGPDELTLGEDLASRAAIALDNARLYRNIQEADRHKDEFLAMLSHELRNPLAPIHSAVQVMQLAGGDAATQRWALEVIGRQVQQMVRLVDDLLDVSRITRGKIALQTKIVNVAEVVASAVETSRPLIETRRHELTVSLPHEVVQARADPTRLAQVISNLLNNAAKYTEEGGHIWITVQREGNEAVFRVRDNGVGIPPEWLPRVFELFTQVDRSLDRSQGGLGIGLTLVYRLVEMHGGRVEVHSAGHDQGSEFVVGLPALAAAPAGADDRETSQPAAARAHSLRTLVVDDNVDGADSLAALLGALGYEVRTAYDGLAALETAEQFRPEVILLDIGLPRLDGYEVARRLRRQSDLADVHIVALTGYGQAEDRQRSQEAGFDHHLTKPVSPETLQELFHSFRVGPPRTTVPANDYGSLPPSEPARSEVPG